MDPHWPEFDRACVEVLGYDPTDTEAFDLFIDYTKLMLEPLTTDGTSATRTRSPARRSRSSSAAARSSEAEGGRPPPEPAEADPPAQDHTFMNRLQWGLASVMAGIGGEGNYRRIAEPWIRGPHQAPR